MDEMNFLDLHPKYRPVVAVLMLGLCSAPAIVHAQKWQAANDERKAATDSIEQSIALGNEQTARDERIALDRASRCIVVDDRFPFTNGSQFYYDPAKREGKRLLPSGTALCNPTSGHTAILDDSQTVTSIKQAPAEKIRQILKQRGLI